MYVPAPQSVHVAPAADVAPFDPYLPIAHIEPVQAVPPACIIHTTQKVSQKQNLLGAEATAKEGKRDIASYK